MIPLGCRHCGAYAEPVLGLLWFWMVAGGVLRALSRVPQMAAAFKSGDGNSYGLDLQGVISIYIHV